MSWNSTIETPVLLPLSWSLSFGFSQRLMTHCPPACAPAHAQAQPMCLQQPVCCYTPAAAPAHAPPGFCASGAQGCPGAAGLCGPAGDVGWWGCWGACSSLCWLAGSVSAGAGKGTAEGGIKLGWAASGTAKSIFFEAQIGLLWGGGSLVHQGT